ncbi:MAG: hypothetical protein ABF479_17500 [Gluconacetobacter sp.]|uniref:Uncharacterized protein n=1 Tax=Gluconacetobacter dulcium TaxID=2729096 RepID=A0A7W4JYQ0_9PROT|nr:hypothetical protein [Gluconacetobacter dulcium]MBB2197180.1 hypothetical protein [Gluconacetobacter dulcium]
MTTLGHVEGSDSPAGWGASDPADRLEQALNRIAFALDRRHEAVAAAPDLQTLAANIDALIARVRDVLGPDEDIDAMGEG